MSAGYTPGPWEVFLFNNYPCVGTSPSATLVDLYVPTLGIVEANARLIAAAPELLEAAQAAWNCIGELPPTQARVEVAQLLQAAIEKAIGVQP